MAKRIHLADLVAFQRARKARPATHAIELEHSPEHLTHDLRRRLNTKRAGNPVASQVAGFGLAIDVDSRWVREYVGLLFYPSMLGRRWTIEGTHITAGMCKVNKYTLSLEKGKAAHGLVG